MISVHECLVEGYGPRNIFLKLVDLSDTLLQVDGPLVHFTLFTISLWRDISSMYIKVEYAHSKHLFKKGQRSE